MERLQRVIAARGISSRRSAEELITGGRVRVNGVVVTELGTRVDAMADEIQVDGKVIRPQRLRTIVLNKPTGYITTMQDDRERRTVMDLIDTKERLFPVGRLDRDTEGMLLLTNDGELANRVMHPSYQMAKEYHVLTDQRPTDRTLQYLRDGVRIDDRDVVPDEIRLLRETREGIWIRLVIHEGFYHAVRRIMEAANINVIKLRRHRIGPLTITGLEAGEYRDLTVGELSQISEAVHLDRDAGRGGETPEAKIAAPMADAPGAVRSGPRQGRSRMVSDRPASGSSRPSESPRGRTGQPERTGRPGPADRRPGSPARPATPYRPAAPSRPVSTPPATPPRSPIVERPGAWAARRPENPIPRPAPGPTAGSVSGDRPRTDAPATGRDQPIPPMNRPEGSPASPAPEGRFETVGGQRFSEVRRTFTSERPAGEAAARRPVRRPAPQRPRRDDVPTGPRPNTERPRPAPRTGDVRPASAPPRWQGSPDRPPRDGSARGPRRDSPPAGPRRNDAPSGPSARIDRSRPTGGPAGARDNRRTDDRRTDDRRPRPSGANDPERRTDDRRPRPTSSTEPERRPAADRGPRLLTQRRTARPDPMGGSGRKLETVGRFSRKVESDNPDEAPSRIKRRSPHPHSHRGAKPKPAAPKINTSKPKSMKKPQGKGAKRGNRR